MKRLLLISCITSIALAANPIKLGVFSLATEAGWGVFVELKPNGKASITPAMDTEDGNSPEKAEKIQGTWKQVKEGIEVSYPGFKDFLKFEQECMNWSEHPCFRYENTFIGNKEKSLLKYEQPYINWAWKNKGPRKSIPKKCLEECSELENKGQLKKGMSVEECAKTTCP